MWWHLFFTSKWLLFYLFIVKPIKVSLFIVNFMFSAHRIICYANYCNGRPSATVANFYFTRSAATDTWHPDPRNHNPSSTNPPSRNCQSHPPNNNIYSKLLVCYCWLHSWHSIDQGVIIIGISCFQCHLVQRWVKWAFTLDLLMMTPLGLMFLHSTLLFYNVNLLLNYYSCTCS